MRILQEPHKHRGAKSADTKLHCEIDAPRNTFKNSAKK